MARLFTCGFEETNAIANIEETIWTSVAGAPTIQTTTVRSGVNALQIASGAGREIMRQLSAAVTTGTFFTRFYFRKAGNPAFDRIIFFEETTGIVSSLRLRILTTGVLQLVNVAAGSTTFDGPTLNNDQWYRIEVRHLLSDTVGQIEVRVDGANAFGDGNFTGGDGTDADTLSTNVERFRFGDSVADFGADIFFDDIIINDATGVAPFNTFPGASKIALGVPGGEVSMQWENGAAGTPSLFTNVDEIPALPDDATTYNMEDDTASQVDRMTLATLPAEIPANANMIALDLYMRVGSTATTARNITNKIWDEANVLTNGPLISAAINGWRIASVGPTNEHQAFDLGARTKANVQDFDIGYDNNSVQAARERRVTALWVNVEWIEAAAPPPGPAAGLRTLAMTGVGI